MKCVFAAHSAVVFAALSAVHGAWELAPASPAGKARVENADVWQTNDTVKFKLPKGMGPEAGKPLYARITYFDDGQGKLQVAYHAPNGEWLPPETHTRSSRVGTKKFVESYHAFKNADVASADGLMRVRILDPDGVPLSVRSITIDDKPFDDPAFRNALDEPWKKPVKFPADPSAPKTLKGTIMVGYQGWVRTPNDLNDNGWRHWLLPEKRSKPVRYSVDMWPDVSAYPKAVWFPVPNLKTKSGEQAYLFSSTSPEVIDQHFRWMREFGIDGAFVQRFMSSRKGGDDGNAEWVLYGVRNAANREKRLWAIEYDVSGLKNENAMSVLTKDWSWLVDELKITADPYYARENGKPVVFVWGLPVESRGFTPEVANEVVEYFKNDPKHGGNYVIGGAPGQWRKLGSAWNEHLRKYDALLTWQGKRYAEDRKDLGEMGVKFYPHVWPGFSWAHLKVVADQYTPRKGGEYYWSLLTEAVKPGNDWLFVGMFDEYDEGTAIMPMSDDSPPATQPIGRFITNEGRDPMWWLKLTWYAKEMLEGKRSPASPMPQE